MIFPLFYRWQTATDWATPSKKAYIYIVTTDNSTLLRLFYIIVVMIILFDKICVGLWCTTASSLSTIKYYSKPMHASVYIHSLLPSFSEQCHCYTASGIISYHLRNVQDEWSLLHSIHHFDHLLLLVRYMVCSLLYHPCHYLCRQCESLDGRRDWSLLAYVLLIGYR